MTPGSSSAVMPADQEAADISGETERAEWSTPREALAAERSGVIRLDAADHVDLDRAR